MHTSESLKQIVQDKYDEIARAVEKGGCCGTSEKAYTTFSEDYSALEGYDPEADLGLGCGLPTEHARISPGDTVLDLGSGAGNDVFVARSLVGDAGRVIGVDFVPSMIEKAEANRRKLGYGNVEFRYGDVESLPVDAGSVNVVISNCVLNLVPDKRKAFAEIFRVLRPGGHFCVSDIVVEGEIPAPLRKAAEMYAGCVSGAVPLDAYLAVVEQAGFGDVRVVQNRRVNVPDEVVSGYLSDDELAAFKSSGSGIRSVTVFAVKGGASA